MISNDYFSEKSIGLEQLANTIQRAFSFHAAHRSCRHLNCEFKHLIVYLTLYVQERGFSSSWTRAEYPGNRSIKSHVSLLLSSSLLVPPPGIPQRAKTNNSAKQGSIRPGSSVTLASHLPGRGLTSQAASRALSRTSSA